MRATTRNGSVVLSFGELNNNAITAETTNGGITLRVPESSNAQLTAETSTGHVQSDFAAGRRREFEAWHKRESLAAAARLSNSQTSTGSIHIQRF